MAGSGANLSKEPLKRGGEKLLDETYKEGGETLPPITDHDIAKNLHRKMQTEPLSEEDHRWLTRYHGMSANELRPKETTPYDGLDQD